MFDDNKKNTQDLNQENNFSSKSKLKYYFIIIFVFLIVIAIIFYIFINNKPGTEHKEQTKEADIIKDEVEKEIQSAEEYSDISEEDIMPWANDPSLSMDIDNDYLLGYEEIEIYQTDPNNPDTDGDGYLDGEEVMKGYNPLGEGKLE